MHSASQQKYLHPVRLCYYFLNIYCLKGIGESNLSDKFAERVAIGVIVLIFVVYITKQIFIWFKTHFLIIAIVLGVIALLGIILLIFSHNTKKRNNQMRQLAYIANFNQELTQPNQTQNNTFGNMQQSSIATNISEELTKEAINPGNSPWKRKLPGNIREQVYKRAQNKCENEECNHSETVHIHHIDMNKDNNVFSNLVALCPNCHAGAHNGKFTEFQLKNWVMRDYRKVYGKSVENFD
jgi:hypothetical protein